MPELSYFETEANGSIGTSERRSRDSLEMNQTSLGASQGANMYVGATEVFQVKHSNRLLLWPIRSGIKTISSTANPSTRMLFGGRRGDFVEHVALWWFWCGCRFRMSCTLNVAVQCRFERRRQSVSIARLSKPPHPRLLSSFCRLLRGESSAQARVDSKGGHS